MHPGERLEWLESLNSLAGDNLFTPAMLAAIEPIDDIGLQIVMAAGALDQDQTKPPRNASFQMMTRFDVFGYFARLNPSLLTAIKMAAAPVWKQRAH